MTKKSLIAVACLLFMVALVPAQEKQFTVVNQELGLEGLAGGSVAWVDFDGDGWVDLYTGRLWKNNEGKKFTLVEAPQLSGPGAWADIDNDGDADFFHWGGVGKLVLNQGEKGFEDISDHLPDLPTKVSLGASLGDFNGDGFVDIYVGGYEGPGYLTDVMYFNNGDTTFREVWRTKGTTMPARGITSADYDEDGDLDIYVSNYRLVGNSLWQNDGEGTFTDVGGPSGTAGDGGLGAWGHTIGSAWGDMDNDGRIDLFVGNFSHKPDYQDRPKFLRNLGSEGGFKFQDMSGNAGLAWQESFASPALGDYDNDGDLDLFFTTVYAVGSFSIRNFPVLYRNEGGWKFVNVTAETGVHGLPPTYQAGWADFDNDGDLDLVSGGQLIRNNQKGHHWIKVRLEGGDGIDRWAVGSQLRIALEKKVLTSHVEAGTGQGNQNDRTLHFGLADHQGPLKLQVHWIDGEEQQVDAEPGKLVVIRRVEKK
ncbi:MAG: CRTAC1 family protein [Pirellulaceae bacterium]